MKLKHSIAHRVVEAINSLNIEGLDAYTETQHIPLLPTITIEITNDVMDYWVGWGYVRLEGGFQVTSPVLNLLKKVLY